jgi:hypothetical protein
MSEQPAFDGYASDQVDLLRERTGEEWSSTSTHVHAEVREIGTRAQEALTEMFFDSRTPLADLTRRYGVF